MVGAEAWAHPVQRVGPGAEGLGAGRERLVERRQGDPGQLRAQGLGECLEQARQRLVEGAIGHHRSNDRTDAGIDIGLAHRMQPVDGYPWQFDGEIEAGRAAFADELDRRKCRAQVEVVGGAAAIESRSAGQEHFERGPVLDTAPPEGTVRMGMGVDEARDDQPVGRIEPFGIVGPRTVEDIEDAALVEEQGDVGKALPVDEHQPAFDQRPARGHGGVGW